MTKFDYVGVDKNGRTVRGSTTALTRDDVEAQLKEFGFREVRVKAQSTSQETVQLPSETEEPSADEFAPEPMRGDLGIQDVIDEEEAAEQDWRRLEVLGRVRRYRKKENVTIAVTLIVVGVLAVYFIFDRMTTITAPQPRIIMRSSSEMLSFKDVYVDGLTFVFVVHAKSWNGNVRVDFKAWDPFGEVAGFGTARLGFIGDHYGGSPEKSGTFNLKKTRYYETIEIRVSGDEGK